MRGVNIPKIGDLNKKKDTSIICKGRVTTLYQRCNSSYLINIHISLMHLSHLSFLLLWPFTLTYEKNSFKLFCSLVLSLNFYLKTWNSAKKQMFRLGYMVLHSEGDWGAKCQEIHHLITKSSKNNRSLFFKKQDTRGIVH